MWKRHQVFGPSSCKLNSKTTKLKEADLTGSSVPGQVLAGPPPALLAL